MSRLVCRASSFFLIMILTTVTASSGRAESPSKIAARIEHYETMLRRRPGDANIRRQLAVLYHNRAVNRVENEQWQEAIADAERALSLDPGESIIHTTLSVAHNNYALVLKGQGRRESTVKHLTAALTHAPEESQVRKNLAAVYVDLAAEAYRKGEYDACRNYLGLARQHDTENPAVYVLSGELAYQFGRYDTAQQDWERALALDPDTDGVRRRLAKLAQDRQRERGLSVQDAGIFRIQFERGEAAQLATEISDILRQAYRDVGQAFDMFPRSVVPVIVYPAQGEIPEYVPDWAAGVYDGKIRLRAQSANSRLRNALLYHEYTHVVLYHLVGPQIPLWLNEGLAEYHSKRFLPVSFRARRRKVLLRAHRTGTLFSFVAELATAERDFLDTLERDRIELVYAQAESFVSFLIQRYSLYHLRRVLARLAEGDSPAKAVEDILYRDMEGLEQDWRQSLAAGAAHE